MSNETTKKFTPILPFDSTGFDNFQIYTITTYTRDLEIAEPINPIKLHNPNMIKYYRCEDVEPVKIGGDR